MTVLHAFRSPARHAHRRELTELVDQLPGAHVQHWYEDLGVRLMSVSVRRGLIDLEDDRINPGAEAYLCGPLPFMDTVRSGPVERGVTESRIHYEVFGPETWASTGA